MALLATLITLVTAPVQEPTPAELAGAWDARLVLDAEGRELPFGLELVLRDGVLAAELVNEPERIAIPEVHLEEGLLRLAMPHYDSVIEARLAGERLEGTWEKTRGKGERARVPFVAERARPAPADAAPVSPLAIAGRWSVDFESDERPAVGVFEAGAGSGAVRGTFLTATGDYRYLAGTLRGTALVLSCFDGAHAFLFEAELQDDERLAGTFWSGNWWKEGWTARRDASAALDDPFQETSWSGDVSLASLAFLDLDGGLVSLASPGLAGLGYVLVLLGTWCPNCNDEAKLLVELDRRYREKGLSIVGLAFELTGEFERDREQVLRFAARHGITFPLLLAGTADKQEATLAFGGLEAVRAFPTTVFLGGDGRVRAVHSGYAGPATGREHEELRARFELLIDELLATPVLSDEPLWEGLLASYWSSGNTSVVFRPAPGGGRGREAVVRDAAKASEQVEPVTLVGDAVWVGEHAWRFDRAAGVLLDPLRAGKRLWPDGETETPLLARRGIETEEELVHALASNQPFLRREALVALANARAARPEATLSEALALLDDADAEVQRTAVWALGRVRDLAARERLLALLHHPSSGLRREAILALLELLPRDPTLALELSPLTSSEPDPIARSALRDGLGEDPGF
jgi:thiol-disulfide isomerase/thioredoxin